MNLTKWRQAVPGTAAAVMFGAVQPAYAYAMGSVISVYYLPDHGQIKENIKIYSMFYFGLAIFSLVVNIIEHHNFAAMGDYLTNRIKERMLSNILNFEIGWFDRNENSTGAICSRLAKDANVVCLNLSLSVCVWWWEGGGGIHIRPWFIV